MKFRYGFMKFRYGLQALVSCFVQARTTCLQVKH